MENADRTNNQYISITDANANADAYWVNNLGTGIERVISSNGNGNSKTKCPKFVNFFINNITYHGYFI